MRPRNSEKCSDPALNPNFARFWTDDDADRRHGLQHIGRAADRVLARVERQRAVSEIAKLLREAERAGDDTEIIVDAFKAASKIRDDLGESWAALIAERAA